MASPSKQAAVAPRRRILGWAHGYLDWGLVVALAVAVFAAGPFLGRAGLPHQTDAELHVYRTAELSRMVRQGVLYPRWAANLYLGYGYPIFNYYAPLTYHLGSAFAALLPGAGVVAGTKAVFVLGLLLASLGAYLLGRELFGAAGGVLAATSFTLSPYVLFIDPHARGDLAEHFAVCLLPLCFYFFRHLTREPRPAVLLGSVLSVAGVVFSHNLVGLTVSALLLAYWLWRIASGASRLGALWGVAALVLAAGLIGFFWLPALWERGAVQLEVIGPGHFDYRQHFLSLRELLAPSRLIDWGATGPRFRHNLGLAQWLMVLPALAVVVVPKRSRLARRGRGELAFYVAAALGLGFLMLPAAATVWETVPLMPYLQFPWRLLGATNVMLAVCAASTAILLPAKPWGGPLVAGIVAVLLATALPLLYPPPWPPAFGGTSAGDVIRWEMRSQALGTTSTGDFLPTPVEVIPSPADTLLESYYDDGPVDKVNRATLPEGAAVRILSHGPRHDLFGVTTPVWFVLRLYTFDFPGWTAYVDGRPVEIEIAHPEGFITVPVPEGEHRVLVRFEDTPARRAGWILSGGSVIVFTALLTLWRPGGGRRGRPPLGARLSLTEGAWPMGVLAAVVLVVVLVDPQGWLHLNSPPGEALPAQHELSASFEGKIELLGYDLPKTRVHAGETFPLVLYWRALTDVEENYQSFAHVAQPLDRAWGQEDHLNPGGLPTARWPTDRYVWDEYEIRVKPETPPGRYKLNVGLYSLAEMYRLKRIGEDGEPIADSLVIDELTVVE